MRMIRAGNCYLELIQHKNPDSLPGDNEVKVGYSQLSVEVDDIEEEYKRLAALGVRFKTPAPVDYGHIKAVVGYDPDGNPIELQQTLAYYECDLSELPATH